MPGFDELRATTFTRTVHSDVYPAIDPSKPELSQAGKTVLIPGGGTGIGFAIATSFVRAGAERIIIISRRAKVLAAAAARLDEEAKGKTKIISKQCDVDKRNEVDALWKWFSDENIVVHVLIANVAQFAPTKSLLDFGTDGVWGQFETNVKSQLLFAEKLKAQKDDAQKVRYASHGLLLSC